MKPRDRETRLLDLPSGHYDLVRFGLALRGVNRAKRAERLLRKVNAWQSSRIDLQHAASAVLQISEIHDLQVAEKGMGSRDDDTATISQSLFNYALILYFRATDQGSGRGHFNPLPHLNPGLRKIHRQIRTLRNKEIGHADSVTIERGGTLIDDRLLLNVHSSAPSYELHWRRKNYVGELVTGLGQILGVLLPALDAGLGDAEAELTDGLATLFKDEPALKERLVECLVDPATMYSPHLPTNVELGAQVSRLVAPFSFVAPNDSSPA